VLLQSGTKRGQNIKGQGHDWTKHGSKTASSV